MQRYESFAKWQKKIFKVVEFDHFEMDDGYVFGKARTDTMETGSQPGAFRLKIRGLDALDYQLFGGSMSYSTLTALLVLF